MRIEEIIRTCSNEQVATAAVSSIGRNFSVEIRRVADAYGMSLGEFTGFAVERFARKGDESEMRAVRAAMALSQEPVLAGLKRILCIALALGAPREVRTLIGPMLPLEHRCHWDSDARREHSVLARIRSDRSRVRHREPKAKQPRSRRAGAFAPGLLRLPLALTERYPPSPIKGSGRLSRRRARGRGPAGCAA